jgi:anti-sigma factor RsiW
LAYLEGEADRQVRDHVARCPACADKVARLRETGQALLTLMYRADCPAPEVLGQYQLDLLSPAEQLQVAAHARACPHCTRELAELAAGDDGLVQAIWQTLRNVTQVVETTLIVSPRPQPAGVRGGRTARCAFRGAGIDVLVGFRPTAQGDGPGTLLGSVVQTDAAPDSQMWLFCEGQAPVSSPVDDLGTFVFEAVTPGEYDLVLETGERALLMREVFVDG